MEHTPPGGMNVALLMQAQELAKGNSEEAQRIYATGLLTDMLKQAESDKKELLEALLEALHKFESMGLGGKPVSQHARAAIKKASPALGGSGA